VARDAECFAVSALTGDGLELVQRFFGAAKTVVLLGSSGVGKSTLVNRVVGDEVMSTGTLRDGGKGRHTTTRRELFVLPGGGAVIDTPGLREVQMWEASGGLSRVFDDIEKLAKSCRFGDCAHDAEPGCAVTRALDEGALSEARFESWRALQKEIAWLQQPASERGRPGSKRRARVGHGVRRK
jgi:ribosome biogenesis GTPase